jgi:hypothetical protein
LTPRLVRVLAPVAVAFATAAASALAQPPSPLQLLDVPYLAQSEQLCGGAAAAMVMRYWGATDVYAESFSSLVDRDAGGIRGEDLIQSLQARGWQASSMQGDADVIRQHLRQRRPPIVLIEDRPSRFHYVVIVGWHSRVVVLHDPARAPFRILDERSFLAAWSRSSYWTLVAVPRADPAATPPPATSDAGAPSTGGICGSMVDEAVRRANGGAVGEAEQLLELATARCPGEAAPWRELAGVHAVRNEWTLAAAGAQRALAADPHDEHAARTLATSLFLTGNAAGALDAWNKVGEPTIDLIDIQGLERMRFAVAARTLGLSPRARLTSSALVRAARRLDALPAVMGSRVTYSPREDGLAEVRAAVIERPVLPTTMVSAAATALRLLTDRELRVDSASPTGGGELWHAAWRWWEERPRLSFGVNAPAPFGGTWGVTASDERQTFGAGATMFEEHTRRAAVTAGDWATRSIAWEISTGVERWPAGRAAFFAAGLQYRTAGNHLALEGRAGGWAGTPRAWLASWSAEWRSRPVHQGQVWLGRVGTDASGDGAPRSTWPGAGTGQGRDQLLRAHPLLHDGVIRDAVFGRGLVHATGEWRRWGRPVAKVLRIAPALFLDVARAYDAPPFADDRAHADAGVGIRIAIPGSGVLRADLARGLRDGQTALSFGWTR